MTHTDTTPIVPPHVPEELVRDFDFVRDLHPGDPYLNISRLHEGPDIFYTPRQGGHWVVTRYEDMESVIKNPVDFSSEEMIIPRVAKPFRLIPIETNPPQHTEYRAIVQPFFSPKKIGDLEQKSRELTLALIADFSARGECEFVSEFALKMPVGIFMSLVDLPETDADIIVPFINDYIHGATPKEKQAAFGQVVAYLAQKLQERRHNLGDDMLSALLKARIEGGRPLTEPELLGFAVMLLAGGLETVAAALSTIMTYLATHDEHRRQLTAHPELINDAIEELLRRHHGVMFGRVVARDLQFKGVTMKAGDMVLVPVTLAGLDSRRYPDPLKVDFTRKDKKHLAFGAGPHACIGSFLGRTELRVFLTEWLQRIPEFVIKTGTTPELDKGQSHSTLSLHLTWTVGTAGSASEGG